MMTMWTSVIRLPEREQLLQLVRFGINGLVATGVQFTVLTLGLHFFMIPSAGIANFIAALFGIVASFLGNRWFVFRSQGGSWLSQASRFGLLYGVLAVMQGGVMFLWSDYFQLDYRWGFLVATGCQIVLSYLGNRRLVFKI